MVFLEFFIVEFIVLFNFNYIYFIVIFISFFFLKWSFYWNLSYLVFIIFLILIITFYFMQIILNNKILNILLKINLSFFFIFFITKNLMLFFIIYELSVFPILLIISFWGYQIERLSARAFFLGYTLFFRIPSFIAFIFLQSYFLSLDNVLFWKINKVFIFLLSFIFLVKLPIFILHIWLPKAHVESPTLGRIILAAVLLKLGGFGLLKVYLFIKEIIYIKLLYYVILVGSIYSCFLCLIQRDLKALVAYRRVVHINFITLSIAFKLFLIKNIIIFVMFFHAFISSIIFFLAGSFFQNIKRRKIIFSSLNRKPIKVTLIILIISFLFNFNIPPSLGIIPEIYYFFFLFKFNNVSFITLILFGIFSSFFCVYLIIIIRGGKISFRKNNINILFIFNIYLLLFIIFNILLIILLFWFIYSLGL